MQLYLLHVHSCANILVSVGIINHIGTISTCWIEILSVACLLSSSSVYTLVQIIFVVDEAVYTCMCMEFIVKGGEKKVE